MQFDSNKIYVNDFIGLNKIEKINNKFLHFNLVKTMKFNLTITDGFNSLEYLRDYTGRPLYILDTLDDLADFIKGKRDFPIFKTDEEEQKEKEVTEKSQECDNKEAKLKELRDVLDEIFDEDLEKESTLLNTKICKGSDCCDRDFDCRNCFMEFIQRIVA